MNDAYSRLQSEAQGSPGYQEWVELDAARSKLSDFYATLQGDPKYSAAHKSAEAWARYEQTAARIAQLAPEARQKMLKSADGLERQSIPMPSEESINTRDMSKLSLTQGERSRIVERIDHVPDVIKRMQAAGKNTPRTPTAEQILREEYAEGLNIGGPLGGAICRAVVGLARDRGYDIHQLVDEHRKPYHHQAFEDAQIRRRRADLIGGRAPQPPFAHPTQLNRQRSSRDVGTYRIGSKKPFVHSPGLGGVASQEPAGTPPKRLFGKKRTRRAWK
jgi:hypothetical protein